MSDYTKKPSPEPADRINALSAAIADNIPVLKAAKDIFMAITDPPIIKRRDEWIEEIALHVKALERRVSGLSVHALSQKPEYISLLIHASQIAMKTHQKEKHQALIAALTNNAMGNGPEFDVQDHFLHLVDTLTTRHFYLLRKLSTPVRVELEEVIKKLEHRPKPNPEAHHDRSLVSDLVGRGLLRPEVLDEKNWVYDPHDSKFQTRLGQDFLHFITEPEEPDAKGKGITIPPIAELFNNDPF